MQETTAPVLNAWESFYVIVGSSGAALTGLMFVVMTLVSNSRQRSEGAISAFSTPSILHFCSALFVAAVISAPWRTLGPVGITIGLTGVFGIGYVIMVTLRMRRVGQYKPVLEDWIWHCVLPMIAYVTFLSTAFPMARHPEPALFGVGAAALLLLFIGIHNAWDIVIFLVVQSMTPPAEQPAVSAPNGDVAPVQAPREAART